LASFLVKRGEFDAALQAVHAWADTGDGNAVRRLVDLLAKRRDIDGLRLEVLRGNGRAANPLIDAVAAVNFWAAERLRSLGLNPDGSIPWDESASPP
jgi:hypothetical protein